MPYLKVSASEIYQALATAPAGVKPRPVKPGGEEMQCLPVEIHMIGPDGVPVAMPIISWKLVPHVAAGADADGTPTPGRAGGLVFKVAQPECFRFYVPYTKAPDVDLPGVHEDAPEVVTGYVSDNQDIPELRGIDPDVFKANPDAVNRSLRSQFKRATPGQNSGE